MIQHIFMMKLWGVKATSDGGSLVISGIGDEQGNYSSSCGVGADNSNIWHVHLIKYDADGNLEWQTTCSSADIGDWAEENIDLVADGVPIIAVDSGQFGFLKLNSFN